MPVDVCLCQCFGLCLFSSLINYFFYIKFINKLLFWCVQLFTFNVTLPLCKLNNVYFVDNNLYNTLNIDSSLSMLWMSVSVLLFMCINYNVGL